MFIAALDVQKDFDVVNHDFLLHKLYFDGVGGGDEWLLLKDLYTDMTTRVKWDGFLSSSFVIRQGVRLGGILSASHYKRYNNSFLIDVEDKFTGKSIGTIKNPHVTCADDMCYIIEIRDELQCMMSTSETYANREHYYPTCYIQSNEIVLTIWINCSLISTHRSHTHETSLIWRHQPVHRIYYTTFVTSPI